MRFKIPNHLDPWKPTMRTASIGAGSIADQVNAVAIHLRQCADLRELEYRWPRISRTLDALADRAASVQRRGGSPMNFDGALAWLTEVVVRVLGSKNPRLPGDHFQYVGIGVTAVQGSKSLGRSAG
jgi:hypothetical protein